ncbi:MAG: hypothetical protein A2X93_07210 [Deltaproteobacteria bacterium GWC2_56_8]|nr:MAG: hypothetical protein A2X99_11990 [Deltaproteobacteria bacterium GWB2_55_19]OGP39011.1 MAG: hypothetical protein A2X93_07210 [Deltaproteobacteria bacterium GWC2_56_8]HAO93317.1 glycosyl transferase [Deltaproteobacteria bacterium]
MSQNRPVVSVVITTYNYAQFLPTAVDSALSQTFGDLEVVIVNDGSTDNTDEVMSPYLADSRVKYIYQERSGQASAKNRGIENSTGAYVAFLDADDYWLPEKLERQMPLFGQRQETGVVFCNAKWVDADNNPITMPKLQKPRRGAVAEHLIVDNFIPFSSSIVKRECFDRHGAFDKGLEMAIDWDLWLRLSAYYAFDFVDSPLMVYRVGHSGQMSKKREKRQEQSDLVMERFLNANPGLISNGAISKARAYTYKNRCEYYQRINRIESMAFGFKSLAIDPLQLSVLLLMLRNFFPTSMVRFLKVIRTRMAGTCKER